MFRVTLFVYIWGKLLFLSTLHAQQGAQCGAWTQDFETKTWAEIKSQMLNQLSHPGTLGKLLWLENLQGTVSPSLALHLLCGEADEGDCICR